MSRTFEVKIPREFIDWASGLSGGVEPTSEEAMLFDQALDFMFTETQRRVHVLTGDLKFTGRIVESEVDGETIVGGITYGGMVGPTRGKEVVYAEFEFARGGSHDPITPAMKSSQMVFVEAFIDMTKAMIERAVGG